MRIAKGTVGVALLGMLAACVVGEELDAPGQLAAGGGHGGECTPSAVMMKGDFDGDGVITNADVDLLNERIDSGDYVAFFDMNADGKLTGRDVSAVSDFKGDVSPLRDRQIAAAFWATEQYRDIRVALADEFGPFTQELLGHGVHWANMDRVFRWAVDPGFRPALPEGLNYTADGKLVAVFYYSPGAVDLSTYDPSLPPRTAVMEVPATEGFEGHHDHWHSHVGACFNGLGTASPDFDQCVYGPACEADLWSAQFHMLHLWMYEYNPCGAFAGINPNVSENASPEPHEHGCPIESVVDAVYPYGSF